MVPVVFLFSEHEDAYLGAARQLLEQCRRDGTARSRYVVSVLEGVLHRRGRTGGDAATGAKE